MTREPNAPRNTRRNRFAHSRGKALSRIACALGTVLIGTFATACTQPDESPAANSSEVSYWLWDANQLPAYQECAAAFERQHPDVSIVFTQLGWNDYWTKLTSSFIAGIGPDVFTDHVSKFTQFAELGVLEPLEELPETAALDLSIYQEGLAEAWVGPDGHRYGMPKDWDTVAMFYDKTIMAEAGITAAELETLEWNPDDGGSFERTLAHLSIDRNGVRGDEPGFDPKHVAVYGLAASDAGGFNGQTQWSAFTGSTGWNYTDTNPWGRQYNYDDPVFQETIDWYFGLAKKGYMAPFTVYSSSNGPEIQLGSGKAALSMNGSWMISTYAKLDGIDLGIAPTPIGPSGERASMFNGLADSISSNAQNVRGAAQWVAFLASAECQNIVGDYGIVFPAVQSGTNAAIAAFESNGIDVSAFTRHVQDGTTFTYPITSYSADIAALMAPAMQDIFANGKPASSLNQTNRIINLLFEQGG